MDDFEKTFGRFKDDFANPDVQTYFKQLRKGIMDLPPGANKIEISFGEVSIELGGMGDGWTVWDSRQVRQGARLIAQGLDFAQACEMAQKISTTPP